MHPIVRLLLDIGTILALISCCAALFWRSGQTARIWSNIRKIKEDQANLRATTTEMSRSNELRIEKRFAAIKDLIAPISVRLARIEGKLDDYNPPRD